MFRSSVAVVFALYLLLIGCQTAPKESSSPPPVVQPAQVEREPEAPSPEPPPPESSPSEAEPIVVTQELFDQTFLEVEAIINELNAVIRARDYEGWKEYLTEDYLSTYSDPEVLDISSRNAVLRSRSIQLKTLEDFFLNVVVPSRAKYHPVRYRFRR